MSLLPVALLLLGLGAEPPLTEDAAVSLAVAQSPALKALSSRVEETRALVDVAGRWSNPELRVQNLRSDLLVAPALEGASYADHPFEKARIGLRWSPPELGLRAERRTDAELDVAQATAQRALAERDLAARVRGLHATAVNLAKQRELAQSALEKRDQMRKLAQRRLDKNAGTSLELSLAEVDYLDAISAQQEAETRRALALDDLRAQVGFPAGAAMELSGDGAACEAPADGATLLEQAVRASNRSREFGPRLEAVDAERARRTLQLVPWPSFVQLSYVFASDNTSPYLTFQFGLSLPLLDWKTADRRALGAKRVRIEEERRAEVMELERRVRRAAAEQTDQVGRKSVV